MGLSPDGKTLYVAETFTFQMTVFDVAADGELSNQRVFKQFDSREADALDGLCVDSAGAVWVTCPFSSEVRRIDTDGTDLERMSNDFEGTARIESVTVDVPRSN